MMYDKKAIHAEPGNDLLWYNLAVCEEHVAIETLRLDQSTRTFAQVELALDALHRSYEYVCVCVCV